MPQNKEKSLGILISREIANRKNDLIGGWMLRRGEITEKYVEIIGQLLLEDCHLFIDSLSKTFKTSDYNELGEEIRGTVSKRINQGFSINELQKAVKLWRLIIIEHFEKSDFKPPELAQIKDIIYSMFYFVLEVILEEATVLLSLKVKQEQETTLKRADQLEVINKISRVITSRLQLDDVCTAIISEIQKIVKFDRATIALLEQVSDELQVITLYPEKSKPTVEKGLKKAGTLVDYVIRQRRAHIVGNLGEDGAFKEDNLLFDEGIRSYINIPLYSKENIVGSFSLGSNQLFAFNEEDLHILEQIAGHITIAIENAQLYAETQSFTHVLETEVENRTKEVREIRDYLNLIIQNSVDAVMVSDSKGMITIFNKAAENLTGYTHPEIIGTDDLPFLNNKDMVYTVLKKEKPEIIETQVLPKSGEEIPVRLSLSRLQTESKNVLGVVCIFRDLRTEKELKQQLIETEKLAAIGKLGADIAHEVNNPLSVIKTSIRILSDKLSLDEDTQRSLNIVNEEIDRITRIIRNLLDFYRPASSKKIPTDINRVIRDLVILVEKQLLKKKIRIQTDLKKGLPELVISPDQIKQVMFNLIRNAEDSMPDGGLMIIDTRTSGDNVMIKVEDNGQGIEKKDLTNLFVPFFTTKKDGKGTGLGLSVTYGIIKNCGGKIDVQSKLDQGSTFVITLPIWSN